jgi:hypothetical protein
MKKIWKPGQLQLLCSFFTPISLKFDGKLIVLVLTTKKTVSARSRSEPTESKHT